MKKIIKILLAVACIAILSVSLTACNFGYPKVAGCTYTYDKTEYDKQSLNIAEIAGVETYLTIYKTNAALTLVFSAEDNTVEYVNLTGMHTYEYRQSAAHVIIYDAPNQNTNYNGTMVTGFTVTRESNEVLTWNIMILLENGKQVSVDMYYNLVASENPAE